MHKAIRLRHNDTRQDSIAHPLGASDRTASWRSSINRCTARHIHCHSDHFTFPEARFGAVIIPRLGVSSTGSSLIGSGLWWSRSAALPYRRTRVGRGRARRSCSGFAPRWKPCAGSFGVCRRDRGRPTALKSSGRSSRFVKPSRCQTRSPTSA
jgi:hypothetical protein